VIGPLVIDVEFLTEADDTGCALIRIWRRYGARFVGVAGEAPVIVQAILGESPVVAERRVPILPSGARQNADDSA
jgi:hypothetical protein